jgi:hypothetical protein
MTTDEIYHELTDTEENREAEMHQRQLEELEWEQLNIKEEENAYC